jgi:hypothetical protein
MAKATKKTEEQDFELNQERNYNPFFESVSEKPYSQVKVNVSPNQMNYGIDEPTYEPQSLDSEYNPYNDLSEDENGGNEQGGKNLNPALSPLSDAEKEASAKQMSEMTIDAYKQIHVFANTMLQFPNKKLKKLESEGAIDLSVPIPYEEGKTITANEFISEFNEQNKDALYVDKDFEKQVKPPLTRVFKKNGVGLSDEQTLIYLFSKDIIMKGVMVAQIQSSINQFIDNLKETTQAYKEGNYQAKSEPQKQHNPQTSTQYKPQNYDNANFNFDTNETILNNTVNKQSVPKTGKDRLFEQQKKEKIWEQNAQNNNNETYKDKLKGKRGRPKKNDNADIADAIVIKETEDLSTNIDSLD